MRTSRTRRAATAAVLGAALALCGAATANARVVTVTDDVAADFAQGTQDNTAVTADGSVRIRPALDEAFGGAGPDLPAGWTSTPWVAGGTATVTGGQLVVDAARADSAATGGVGSSLRFRATLGTRPFRHVGFAQDFANPPWVMFSTGGDGAGVYARAQSDAATPPGPDDGVALRDAAGALIDPAAPHDYRIDWTATGFDYYVDGAKVATRTLAPGAMHVAVSDFDGVDPTGVSVDSIALDKPGTGTYTSRALDAGDVRVVGLKLAPTGTTPPGSTITYEARTGTTPDPASWSAAWRSLDALAGSPARYVQYRATLTAGDGAAMPSLDKVVADFDVDDQAPKVTFGGVAVSGSTATATFSADDPAARLECSLDGAAYAACSSPATFSGLSVAAHSLSVRATDPMGNAGTASTSFTVQAPPSTGGGGGTTPGGTSTPTGPSGGVRGETVDHSAPRVKVSPSSLRASRKGVVRLRLRCPATESRCRITVSLERKGARLARRTVTVKGGHSRWVKLRLNRAARADLAEHRRLKAKVRITARDAAGNRRKSTKRLTLRAPAR